MDSVSPPFHKYGELLRLCDQPEVQGRCTGMHLCRIVLQIDGATPLFIASCKGHIECVRALLDGGAAIDQSSVSYAGSRACPRVLVGGAGATFEAFFM
jgi:hypothetical protein